MRSSTVLLVSTIAWVVLEVAGGVALGEAPGADATGPEVVGFFTGHAGGVRLYAWLMAVLTPFFLTFAALSRQRMPAPHRDVFFAGAIALAAQNAVATWFWAGMSWHADQLEPATARTLLDITSFWGPVLNGVTITMLAPVVLLSWGRSPLLPKWLGIFGAVALLEQMSETVTVFGKTGFIAPGGPMNLMLGAGLVITWNLCLGIVLSRRPIVGVAA